MRCLVTGDRGYIGTELAKHLDFEGYDLVDGKDILNHRQLAEAVEGKDAVVHLAGIVGEKACSNDTTLAYRVNVGGTFNLIRACKMTGVPLLIFASSCSIHGALKGHFNHYNSGKLAGELMCFMNDYKWLRFGSIYGGKDWNIDYLVDDMLIQGRDFSEIIVQGETIVRPLVHVEDVARAIVFTLDHPPDRFYEVASENLSKRRIAERIQKRYPCSLKIQESKATSYFGNSKLLEQSGFTFKWTLDKYLDEITYDSSLEADHTYA